MALYYRMRFLREGRVRWPKPEDSPLVRHPSPTKFRVELGLPPLSRLNPDCTLCMWPDWFAAAQPDWPEACVIVGFPLYPRPLPRVEGGAKPVIITAGTMATGQREFFDRAARACRTVGLPGLIVSPHASNVPSTLPDGVTHLAYAPFAELLSQASLIVHHGGIGTTAYAMAAGVPQLMTPLRGDQFDNANRVQRLGVGAMLSGHASSVEDLAALMRHYVDSPYVARRCNEFQRRIDPDAGLRRAAQVVEQVVREGTARVAA
jgi:UDP:flavonoid glycosyltransferase YjiC (YdhE family)